MRGVPGNRTRRHGRLSSTAAFGNPLTIHCSDPAHLQWTITPLNRPNFTRFDAVARWDFQERARLILPNKDGWCKRFLQNLAAPLLEPVRHVSRGPSQVSQIRTKRKIRQYPSNREVTLRIGSRRSDIGRYIATYRAQSPESRQGPHLRLATLSGQVRCTTLYNSRMCVMRTVPLAVAIATLASAQQSISFPAKDGGRVCADLYGQGTRAVVLAHGGRFNK